jgi:hypothetical protein
MYIIDLLQHSELKIAELKSELYCFREVEKKRHKKRELILEIKKKERAQNKKDNSKVKKTIADAKRAKRTGNRKPS